MSKKIVLKSSFNNEKGKQKVLKAVSGLPGIESLSADVKDGKLTVVGEVDPVRVVARLKKVKCHTEILTVGPAKEPEKKPDPKKEAEEKKKKEEEEKKRMAELIKAYYSQCNQTHNPCYNPPYWGNRMMSIEENPNACVIS
ncbi:hypothetical protein SAY87_015219 [Trapa incisa]|uniref:HMA domain-containing protein n=1 Tax=Trapa incisa TaxID=236973 RepID=A0AAN7GQA4_9MYRT|nr:hypothetical protein SAY87_015219 [Trapa incisa]